MPKRPGADEGGLGAEINVEPENKDPVSDERGAESAVLGRRLNEPNRDV